jgi:DNA-binding CsgD family transcriptional regulator
MSMAASDSGDLSDLEVAVYRAALADPDLTTAQLVGRLSQHGPTVADDAVAGDGLAVSAEAADKAIARLADFGLVRYGENDRLCAMSPMLAEATTLGAEDLELGARRAAIERKRDTIRRLVPMWNEASAAFADENHVDVILDQGEIANALMHFADNCEEELLSVAPGRLASTRIDGRTRLANVYSARRGIHTRALYQHTALRDRATRAYLRELSSTGARIRLAPSVPGRSLVIDRSVALLPIPTADPGRHGLAVVRERNVISWVVATFEQLWAEASPLEEVIDSEQDDTELDQTRVAILRLMADGEKDEAISRRLSISVRTCRRHIADYMAQVGASSRFQAGVIAARAGHLDPSTHG